MMKIKKNIKNLYKRIVYGEFTCCMCGETFTKGLSEKEARKQFKIEFPNFEFDPNMEMSCEDCFQEMNDEIPTKTFKE